MWFLLGNSLFQTHIGVSRDVMTIPSHNGFRILRIHWPQKQETVSWT